MTHKTASEKGAGKGHLAAPAAASEKGAGKGHLAAPAVGRRPVFGPDSTVSGDDNIQISQTPPPANKRSGGRLEDLSEFDYDTDHNIWRIRGVSWQDYLREVWYKPSDAAKLYRYDPYWAEDPEWKPESDESTTLIRVGSAAPQLLRSNRWVSHRTRVNNVVQHDHHDVGRLVIITNVEAISHEGLVNWAEDFPALRYFLRPLSSWLVSLLRHNGNRTRSEISSHGMRGYGIPCDATGWFAIQDILTFMNQEDNRAWSRPPHIPANYPADTLYRNGPKKYTLPMLLGALDTDDKQRVQLSAVFRQTRAEEEGGRGPPRSLTPEQSWENYVALFGMRCVIGTTAMPWVPTTSLSVVVPSEKYHNLGTICHRTQSVLWKSILQRGLKGGDSGGLNH